MNTLQRAIRSEFRKKTGVAIDYQNKNDLYAIMRVAFINNSGDHNTNVQEQVRFINGIVIKTALGQIQSGVSQYMGYIHDIDTPTRVNDLPVNTTTYGKKFGKNEKIGF